MMMMMMMIIIIIIITTTTMIIIITTCIGIFAADGNFVARVGSSVTEAAILLPEWSFLYLPVRWLWSLLLPLRKAS